MKSRDDNLNLGFIGLGKLGLPCAEKFSEQFNVYGYDVVERRNQLKDVVWCPEISGVVKASDLVFIAVPTPHDVAYDGSAPTSHLEPRDFDYSAVTEVLTEISKENLEKKLVVLISTVLPGTIRRIMAQVKIQPENFLYNPFLIAMGTVAHDLVNPEMIIVGNESGKNCENSKLLASVYEKLIPDGFRLEFGTWEEAESIKIFYNTFISAKLSLVNMIQDVANSLGHMNSDVVANAIAKSSKRIMSPTYMKPGMGDGGPCHPRDNIALRHLAKEHNLGYDLFGSIMDVREQQAKNLAMFILRHGYSICILGRSFKPGVPQTEGSYSVLVSHFLKEKGATVKFENDPIVDGDVFLLAHRGGFYDFTFPHGATVIDPWREYPNKQGIKLIPYGFSGKN